MQETGRQPLAVIEYQCAAGEIHVVMGQGDDAAGWRIDRAAGRRRDVQTVVRPARLAVEDALAAVDATDAASCRPGESAAVIRQRVAAGPGRGHHGGFLPNTLERLRIGGHCLRRQAVDAFDGVIARGYLQRHGLLAAVRIANLQAA